ncbi:MAG: hypothetical protein AAGI88_13835 [Pseudomonadota bacterium]
MLKEFLKGAVFGLGFATSCAIIWVVLDPLSVDAESNQTQAPEISWGPPGDGPGFFDQTVEEQIASSTVIALTRYVDGPEGKISVLDAILKRTPGTDFYYEVGGEFPSSDYFDEPIETWHGDGQVVFLSGSPAMIRASMSYRGERIRSLGDMPLRVFLEKCEADDA